MNSILVESVRELKAELEAQDLPFNEKYYHYFNKLTIVEFNLKLEIVDYYDGKERLEFNGVEIDTF